MQFSAAVPIKIDIALSRVQKKIAENYTSPKFNLKFPCTNTINKKNL